jgi:hypothetical protein
LARDPFALGNLEARVDWTGWEALPALWLLLLLLPTTYWLRHGQWSRALGLLLPGMALFVMLTLYFDINKIEAYSQRAAINFFEAQRGEAVYVTTHAYKSYAHLFYSRKPPGLPAESADREWLLSGPIDRPVYVSTKVTRADDLATRPGYTRIGAANGFVFFRRDPE